jgi:MFS transporter, DHA1 family, staphyloferrin A biosynthesis exporter
VVILRDRDQNENHDLNQNTQPKIQPFRSFRYPAYRIFFASLLGQMASMNMQILARTLLIYRLTGSAAILGAMSLAFALPMIALSLFGGVFADRVEKKKIMFAGNAVLSLVSLIVALALYTGYMSPDRPWSWWILVMNSVFQGIVMALAMPARQAIIPELVGKEQIMNATSLNTMGMNSMRLFAPALAGFLIDTIGFAAVFFTMSCLYVLSASLVALLPRSKPITNGKIGGTFSDIKAGINYLMGQPVLLSVLLFALAGVLLAMPYQQLLTIFADDILMVGASGLGIMMSISGVGAIVGSIVIASLPNKRRGLLFLSAGLFLGVALTAFSFSNQWTLSLFLVSMIGLGMSAGTTLSSTLVQSYVDNVYRGRVMSILMMEYGLMSFGTFTAGLLTEIVGVQMAVGSFGILLTVIAFLCLIFLKRIRQLD